MFVFVLIYLLLIYKGWCDVLDGEIGPLAVNSIVFTAAVIVLFGVPIFYKVKFKKKVRSNELTERQAFNKLMDKFGMECAVIAYGITFDKYFWFDPDDRF